NNIHFKNFLKELWNTLQKTLDNGNWLHQLPLSKVFCSVFQSSLRKFLKWMLFSQIVVIPF
ncbi:hypothetical protein F3F28_29940, partial [Bacteroides ovatus]